MARKFNIGSQLNGHTQADCPNWARDQPELPETAPLDPFNELPINPMADPDRHWGDSMPDRRIRSKDYGW